MILKTTHIILKIIFLATLLAGMIFQSSKLSMAQEKPNISFGGYVDAYYSYDNDKNGNLLRQFSSISPNREEFRLNIAQINGTYSADNVRASLSVQYGDIPAVNWPASMQYIQQANAGFSPVKNLWIDAGYFLTHIGAEGLLPKDNFVSSHALATYFEPFYQSGVKVTYEFSPKFNACIHLLNGYNVLADNNKNKSAGITLDFKPNSKSEIVYNNLVGNEQPSGGEAKVRVYNNLVFKYAITKKLDFIAGIDFALQEKSKITDSTSSASVFSGLAALKYRFTKKFSASVRGEMFNDENGMLSGIYTDSDGKPAGLKASGVTLGLEYKPADNVFVRIETRYLNADSKLKIFNNGSTSRVETTLNTAVWF